jgi:hypothetical protein
MARPPGPQRRRCEVQARLCCLSGRSAARPGPGAAQPERRRPLSEISSALGRQRARPPAVAPAPPAESALASRRRRRRPRTGCTAAATAARPRPPPCCARRLLRPRARCDRSAGRGPVLGQALLLRSCWGRIVHPCLPDAGRVRHRCCRLRRLYVPGWSPGRPVITPADRPAASRAASQAAVTGKAIPRARAPPAQGSS